MKVPSSVALAGLTLTAATAGFATGAVLGHLDEKTGSKCLYDSYACRRGLDLAGAVGGGSALTGVGMIALGGIAGNLPVMKGGLIVATAGGALLGGYAARGLFGPSTEIVLN
jgi:hypothetical protein